MIDKYQSDSIKATTDCRNVVEAELGPPIRSDRGGCFVWACPFHSESTVGGFKVFQDGYKCFSCGEWGDIYTWRERRYNETFAQAVEYYSNGAKLEPEKMLQVAQELAERTAQELQSKIDEAQEALTALRDAQTWITYHEQMCQHGRDVWRDRGIEPEWFIDWWKLGWCKDFSVWVREIKEHWHSPTLTIPIWGEEWEVNNLKHRLMKPPEFTGYRYRPESSNIKSAPFIANADVNTGALLLVEGEIKAMVSFITVDDPNMQVAGLPAVSPDLDVFRQFSNYDPVYLLLDPDAYVPRKKESALSPVDRAVNALGAERTVLLRLPMKVDDAILARALDKYGMRQMIRTGRRNGS